MDARQKPLELILARNLLGSLSTPAMLVDGRGALLFLNEACGMLIGRRFEETGPMTAEQWTQRFGPFDAAGQPLPVADNPATGALRDNRAHHGMFRIRVASGQEQMIEASSIPIVGSRGLSGAIVIFWPVLDGEAR